MKYDLKNPTRARRVIYSGIKDNPNPITVEAGGTKSNVELSDAVVAELRARCEKVKDSDLIVTDALDFDTADTSSRPKTQSQQPQQRR